MAESNIPPDVRLICGMISARQELLVQAARELEAIFGCADIISEVMPFDFTHYYDCQMGSPLYRQFASFESLVKPDALAAAKVATNRIEGQFAERSGGTPARPINLDPGYVDQSKLVLASMKDFSHRIYLGGGVYGEITLMYHKGSWEPLRWTFPDYASGRYHPFLTEVRQRLRRQLQLSAWAQESER